MRYVLLSENKFTDFDTNNTNRCFGLDFDNQGLTESSDTQVYGKL